MRTNSRVEDADFHSISRCKRNVFVWLTVPNFGRPTIYIPPREPIGHRTPTLHFFELSDCFLVHWAGGGDISSICFGVHGVFVEIWMDVEEFRQVFVLTAVLGKDFLGVLTPIESVGIVEFRDRNHDKLSERETCLSVGVWCLTVPGYS